ncbi:hypothetical protein H312_01065 [Anncaliia algerae PRA339]|uniref:Lysosomal dipeptide transporter MFSD1 n=1 Tax=Anncaliia algerae PRA339 TaxID=1288291 RepID=A0A059F309_9MICR|nr:hypothetical protein H312_01065 [Anncaliia algerae PRA339]
MKEKYCVLFASGLIQFISWFCFDFPGSINKNFGNYVILSSEKAVLYSYIAYAFPNIIITLLFGYFISVHRIRMVTLLCLLIVMGNTLFLLGFIYNSFGLIILGRIFAGIGGENFTLNQNKKLTSYFKDSELAFAFSVFNIIGKLGMLTNFLIVPWIIQKFSVVHAISLGVIITFIGLFIGIYLDNKDTIKEMKEIIEDTSTIIDEKIGIVGNYNESINREVINTMFYENLLPTIDQNVWDENKDTYPMEVHKMLESPEIKSLKVEEDVIIITPGIKATDKIHFTFYIYTFMVLVFTFSWAPFYNISSFIFQKKYLFDNLYACKVIAYIEIGSLFFYSGISYFVDHFGYKLFVINLGLGFLLLGHLLIFLNNFPLKIAGLFISIGFPFFNCHWPCLPLLINNKKVGFGYGCVISMINLGYVLSPMILSTFVERDLDYNFTYYYIILLTILTLIISCVLAYFNRKYEIGMNDPEKKKFK